MTDETQRRPTQQEAEFTMEARKTMGRMRATHTIPAIRAILWERVDGTFGHPGIATVQRAFDTFGTKALPTEVQTKRPSLRSLRASARIEYACAEYAPSSDERRAVEKKALRMFVFVAILLEHTPGEVARFLDPKQRGISEMEVRQANALIVEGSPDLKPAHEIRSIASRARKMDAENPSQPRPK